MLIFKINYLFKIKIASVPRMNTSVPTSGVFPGPGFVMERRTALKKRTSQRQLAVVSKTSTQASSVYIICNGSFTYVNE